MPISVILTFIFVHWVADFLCQTRWMANNKSKEITPLLTHTGLYTLIWIIPINFIFVSYKVMALFLLVTFIFHTITDYITSKETSKAYKDKMEHKFFTLIGFDQFLHMAQLFLTYYFLIIYSYLL